MTDPLRLYCPRCPDTTHRFADDFTCPECGASVLQYDGGGSDA